MSTAVATAVEILQGQPDSQRAMGWLASLAQAAASMGSVVERSTTYRGQQPWLLLWGPGAPERAAVMQRHVAAGGHVVALDLAYWDRHRKARVSIDAAHPVEWVMRRDWPRARFVFDQVLVQDVWNPDGPVLIAGIGDKARVQYGASVVDRWEAEMMRACRERWPSRPVLYRRKKAGQSVPAGAHAAPMRPIDEAMVGLSLVVTWHSNVAVDAIRNGIPVICRDGAAAAVCPSVLRAEDPRPLSVDVRDRFLGNLAWFQWAPDESRQLWAWLLEVLA